MEEYKQVPASANNDSEENIPLISIQLKSYDKNSTILHVPAVIGGRFKLLDRISNGAYGVVYSCLDLKSEAQAPENKVFACKMVSPSAPHSLDPEKFLFQSSR
jgi:hypothetical protein